MPRMRACFLSLLSVFSLSFIGCTTIPTGTAPPPPLDVSVFEAEVIGAINEARRRARLEPVTPDPRLAAISRAHSQDMARRDFFAHETPNNLLPADRARRANYAYSAFAENLFRSSRYRRMAFSVRDDPSTYRYDWYSEAELAQITVQSWLRTRGHRENLLDPDFSLVGLGIAEREFDVLITLNLSAPPRR